MLHYNQPVGVNSSKIQYSLQIQVFYILKIQLKLELFFFIFIEFSKLMRETAIDIFSGGVAGMVSTAMGHPFDTLKECGH